MDYPEWEGVPLGTQAFIRDYCGWHIAPVVEETLILDGSEGSSLMLPTLHIKDVLSVKVGGTDLSYFEWSQSGYLRKRGSWGRRLRSVEVTLRHGYENVPAKLLQMAGSPVFDAAVRTSAHIGQVSISMPSQTNTSGMNPFVASVLDPYVIPGV